jgi:hypothetical protein
VKVEDTTICIKIICIGKGGGGKEEIRDIMEEVEQTKVKYIHSETTSRNSFKH